MQAENTGLPLVAYLNCEPLSQATTFVRNDRGCRALGGLWRVPHPLAPILDKKKTQQKENRIVRLHDLPKETRPGQEHR